MNHLLGNTLTLVAGNDLLTMLTSLLPMVVLLAISYFLLIRPEKKRKLQYQAMMADLKVNDEILTKGGVVGKIIKMDEKMIIVESGPDRVRLRMVRDAVLRKMDIDNVSVEEA
ncbi:MAG: preprotein translocase subunit YajC [Clostridiaceae bacterium]